MVKVHLDDGSTLPLDLQDEDEAKAFLSRLDDPSFQQRITGIALVQSRDLRVRCPECARPPIMTCSQCGELPSTTYMRAGHQLSLAKPKRGTSTLGLEVVENREIATLQYGGTTLQVTTYRNKPAAHISLRR